MGLTFLALSSFPPFSQSCHSLGQQREREKESTLCQLSRVTSALVLFGSNGNKLSESSECHESHKRTCKRTHSYMHECTLLITHIVHMFTHTLIQLYTYTCKHMHTLTLWLWKGIGWIVCVCVCSHAGQSDVPSHICQHPEFIYPVILSFVDLVTWSESGRCRTPGTPESPVRTWWETRACDLTH